MSLGQFVPSNNTIPLDAIECRRFYRARTTVSENLIRQTTRGLTDRGASHANDSTA